MVEIVSCHPERPFKILLAQKSKPRTSQFSSQESWHETPWRLPVHMNALVLGPCNHSYPYVITQAKGVLSNFHRNTGDKKLLRTISYEKHEKVMQSLDLNRKKLL